MKEGGGGGRKVGEEGKDGGRRGGRGMGKGEGMVGGEEWEQGGELLVEEEGQAEVL